MYAVVQCLLIIKFDQHAACLNVVDRSATRPEGMTVRVQRTGRTVSIPPGVVSLHRAAASPSVVIVVHSAEHPAVGVPDGVRCCRQGVAGITAVPGHRQLILTDLISDEERGIFSRIPQTRCTLNLLADTPFTLLSLNTSSLPCLLRELSIL